MKKLMNNPICGFIFGVIITLLFCIAGIGEINVWAFAGISGLLIVGAKEVLNCFIYPDSCSKENLLWSSLGVVLTALSSLLWI